MVEDIGEFLVPYLPEVKLPRSNDRIYKDECCLGFDTPKSEKGLYMCMRTFKSFGHEFVTQYHQATGNRVFLKFKKTPIPKTETEKDTQAPTKLAIGVEGGFQGTEKEQEYSEEHTIVILPDFIEISTSNIESIPFHLLNCVEAVIKHDSAEQQSLVSWEGDVRPVSRHSETLKQLDGVKIPPSGWKCTNCDLTANLWANLTDGTILCGRRHFDGSGGNDHALEHYRKTGYPLAVKLGTITAGGADVYSYDEDDMVIDSKLAKHLAHFGINMMNMEKSDKTMTELQIDINQKLGSEWIILQESGKELTPVHGAYLTGLINMGNTCYLNTVVQVLCSIEELSNAYLSQRESIYKTSIGNDPASDFNTQMAKIFWGLSTGLHSSPNNNEESGIKPSMFKQLVGKDHVEFSSGRQQDAQEYLLHVLSLMEKHGRKIAINPTNVFKFGVEERLECGQSKMVRYSAKSEYIMELNIPTEAATNLEDLKQYELEQKGNNNEVKFTEKPRMRVPYSACLESYFKPEVVEGFYSPAVKEKTTALKSSRFSSFPNILVVHLKKFTLGDDWVPKKLDVDVNMPDIMDLEKFRAKGIQDGEVPLPEEEQEQQPKIKVDEEMVAQLTSFGFPREACVKAVHYTGGAGIEAAMNWLMDHTTDADFATPMSNPSEPASVAEINDNNIAMVMSMGFTRHQAMTALKATNDNVERAVDWIFNHIDDINAGPEVQGDGESSNKVSGDHSSPNTYQDGCGKYELFAFISHMGTSTLCGHYVCHIKRDGKWIIFNDEKVAESEQPPKNLGYLYFYKRRAESSS